MKDLKLKGAAKVDSDSPSKRNVLSLEIKNMVLKTAIGEDVDFYERHSGESQVGDKATIDGAQADGVYLMASGDVYVFEKGTLKEIVITDMTAEEILDELKFTNSVLDPSRLKAQKKVVPIASVVRQALSHKSKTRYFDGEGRKKDRKSDARYAVMEEALETRLKEHIPLYNRSGRRCFELGDLRKLLRKTG